MKQLYRVVAIFCLGAFFVNKDNLAYHIDRGNWTLALMYIVLAVVGLVCFFLATSTKQPKSTNIYTEHIRKIWSYKPVYRHLWMGVLSGLISGGGGSLLMIILIFLFSSFAPGGEQSLATTGLWAFVGAYLSGSVSSTMSTSKNLQKTRSFLIIILVGVALSGIGYFSMSYLELYDPSDWGVVALGLFLGLVLGVVIYLWLHEKIRDLLLSENDANSCSNNQPKTPCQNTIAKDESGVASAIANNNRHMIYKEMESKSTKELQNIWVENNWEQWLLNEAINIVKQLIIERGEEPLPQEPAKKIPCVSCGTRILTTTANDNCGLCAPCFKKL